jgi:competence protein ComFA
VGWTDNYPEGRVWFVATEISPGIDGCVRKIKLLNEEATKRGYLDMIKVRKHNIE